MDGADASGGQAGCPSGSDGLAGASQAGLDRDPCGPRRGEAVTGAVTKARFAATAERLAALGVERIEGLRQRVGSLLELGGNEVVVDAAAGTGPMAMALAPLVREVIAVDLVPEMLDQGRRAARSSANIRWLEGDVYALPLEDRSVDAAAIVRTLHHLDRPGVAIAELARVVKRGGSVLVVDQVASEHPRDRALYERIEVLRDPSHVRTLTDTEVRRLLAEAGLALVQAYSEPDERDLATFVELAGCDAATRDAVFAYVEELVERWETAGVGLRRAERGFRFTGTVGWYVGRADGEPVGGGRGG